MATTATAAMMTPAAIIKAHDRDNLAPRLAPVGYGALPGVSPVVARPVFTGPLYPAPNGRDNALHEGAWRLAAAKSGPLMVRLVRATLRCCNIRSPDRRENLHFGNSYLGAHSSSS